MHDHHEQTPTLQEMLDACRPGQADEQLPELRALREQLATDPELRQQWQSGQAWDRRFAAQLQDVPVPTDLAQRLRAACQAAAVTPVEVAPRVAASRSGRRIWLAAMVATAAAFAVLAAWPYVVAPPQVQWHDVAATIPRWTQQLQEDQWRGMDVVPRQYPPSSQVRGRSPRRWQTLQTPLDARTVAYDYAPLQPQSFLVYVARPPGALALPGSPPLRPQATGGWSIAAWQQEGLVYVIALRGDEQEYRRALASPQLAGPIQPASQLAMALPANVR